MVNNDSIQLLIAEDDLAFLKALATYLGRGDSRKIVLAKDGGEAVGALKGPLSMDIVLADLVMPDMDGIDVLKRALEINPETLVIMMTGYGTIDTAVQAMREGAYDFKAKPFLLEEMELTVRRAETHLRLKRERDELAERSEGLARELQLKSAKLDELAGAAEVGDRPEKYLHVLKRELGLNEASFLYKKSAASKEDEDMVLLKRLVSQGAIPSEMYQRIKRKLSQSRERGILAASSR